MPDSKQPFKLKDLKPGMYVKTSHGDVVEITDIKRTLIGVANSDYYAWYCLNTGKIVDLKGQSGEESLVEVLIPQEIEN